MEVVDAKHQAKLILKEIMDQHPGDHDLTAIWDVWSSGWQTAFTSST